MERKLVKVGVDELVPNDWNVNFMTEPELKELASQMQISGPDRTPAIMVRKVSGKYQITNGEQRWKAAKSLGWKYLWAEVVDIDEETAIYQCLSFNIRRGRVHPVKLYLLLKKRPNVIGILRGINDELAEYTATSASKLTQEALEVLDNALAKGAKIDAEMVAEIAKLPPRLQPTAAEVAATLENITLLRAYIQDHLLPFMTPEERGIEVEQKAKEEEEAEAKAPFTEKVYVPPLVEEELERAEAKGEGEKVEAKFAEKEREAREVLKDAGKIAKLPELSAYTECGSCGQPHIICYDQKSGKLGLKMVKNAEGVRALMEQGTSPETREVECPRCGLKGIEYVEEGKIKWYI